MHDNKLIFSVKIIHHELVGFEYRLLADYFRLVGSFICDCTLKTDPKGDFDVVVIIDGDNSLKEKIEQIRRLTLAGDADEAEAARDAIRQLSSEILEEL